MIAWTRVKAGEAPGGKNPEDGWLGRSSVGLYVVWVQARPRDDGRQYAGARLGPDGRVERYGGIGDGPRPPGVSMHNSWLCDRGSFADAKAACEDDAKARRSSAP